MDNKNYIDNSNTFFSREIQFKRFLIAFQRLTINYLRIFFLLNGRSIRSTNQMSSHIHTLQKRPINVRSSFFFTISSECFCIRSSFSTFVSVPMAIIQMGFERSADCFYSINLLLECYPICILRLLKTKRF